MKKRIIILLVSILIVICLVLCIIFINSKSSKVSNNQKSDNIVKELPKPEVTGGERGKLGIDKNINELNIDDYLGRDDSVYRDMRMLEDPGNYEAIGGDSYLSGYVNGFEIVSLPYIIPVTGLPDEVGDTYTGDTLFRVDETGKYIANYEESLSIVEKLFPKDKNIFLMCGGGGYAGMTKSFLVSLGWDPDKIYNVGGYWYYDGKNNVEVKKYVNGKIVYDFDNVPYHKIDFNNLTKIKTDPNSLKIPVGLDSEYYNKIKDQVFDDELNLRNVENYDTDFERDNFFNSTVIKKANIINDLIDKKKSFVVLVQPYEEACRTIAGDEDFFYMPNSLKNILSNNKIYKYEINMPIFRKTKLYDVVKYAPTVIVVKDGDVYAYIDANKDLIENSEDLEKWLKTYIKFSN